MTDAPFTTGRPVGRRVGIRYAAPERPELPPLRVPAMHDLPFLDAPSGDDPFSAVLAVIVFLVSLRVRVAGWPTALVERHRLAARLSLG